MPTGPTMTQIDSRERGGMAFSLIRVALGASVAASALTGVQALAQDATPPAATASATTPVEAVASTDPTAGVGDIIVTARRRDETSIATPVAITAVSGAELERRNINTVDTLARVVPTLITSEATSSPQGGIVAIRGLSGVDGNPFGDQAVAFNIDGVQVARSSVRRLSQMDISQIEVLKGPQALFFGKNSPAGIIAIRTGDPTSTFTGSLSSAYEFKADETRTEGYLAGPITDTLGFRVAGYYDHMVGYVRNIVPETGTGIFPQYRRRVPNGTEYAGRVTLKWEPSDRFNARLKVSYSNSDGSGSTDNLQFVSCGRGGVPQTSTSLDDCKADGKTTVTNNIGPLFGQVADPRFGEGKTKLKSDQWLAGLEMNYNITDTLKLSSISGYYDAGNFYLGQFTANYQETGVIPKVFLPAVADLSIRELSQELRLSSDYDGPVNFMVGGYFQDTRASVAGVVYLNANRPTFSSNYRYRQDGTAYSMFGQAIVKFLPELELSVGGRYSYEKKTLPVFQTALAATPRTLYDIDGINRISFNNLSPEATLSYRPNNRLTIYGGYKEGFLSGGFNATQPVVGPLNAATNRVTSLINPSYDQQITRGFEGGIKAALLDSKLRTNLTLYSYRTTGLQVATLVNLQQQLANAGAVRTKGVEFDFAYRTPLQGLTLNGAVSYERGRYLDYQATCYRGLAAPQCIAQVNRFTKTSGLFNDLSGTQLVRAPEWSGNAGFDYLSQPFGGVRIGLNGNASHSDGFFTDVVSAPGGRQKGYELYDASVRVVAENNRWELALIGRNLGNTYYFTRSADNPFTGSAPGGAAATAFLGDTVAVPSRGREIWVKATVRFGG
ncbi:MAG: TonB-dependent receptor [Sphingomonadales bacterium]|nr:MAG: TonB-dependent receptor [Sphingomonadales bacterium]